MISIEIDLLFVHS